MFYDLNIPWPVREDIPLSSKKGKKGAKPINLAVSATECTDSLSLLSDVDKKNLSEIVYELKELGYTTVAFNHIVKSKYDPLVNPYPFKAPSTLPNPPFPKLDPRTRTRLGIEAFREGLTQLSRLTLILDNDAMIKSGTGFVTSNSQALQQYDILAVTPLTETAFQHACITMSELKPFSIDIISLDLASAPRLPFYLKRSTVGAALANGVVFEIAYGPAVGSSQRDDQDLTTARRNLFSGAREILRVTNGKGVILSSAAADVMGLRGPYDVMNLATLMGLPQQAAKDALSNTCRSLCIRAQTRQTFRGAASKPSVLAPFRSPSSYNSDVSEISPKPSQNSTRKRKIEDTRS